MVHVVAVSVNCRKLLGLGTTSRELLIPCGGENIPEIRGNATFHVRLCETAVEAIQGCVVIGESQKFLLNIYLYKATLYKYMF